MRDFIGFNEFLENELNNSKYADSIRTNASAYSMFEKRTIEKWVSEITELARKGYEVPWRIMNDLWNLDIESMNNYVYRLIHDNPNINIDSKWTRPNQGTKAKGWTKRGDISTLGYSTRESAGVDFYAIAMQYGVNDKKKAEKIYSQALDTTRRLVGNLPQNNLEREFPKELNDNFQDLLQMSTDQNYRENIDRKKESMSSRDALKIMADIEKIEILFAEGITGKYADGKVFRNVKEANDFFKSIPMDDSQGYDKVQSLITLKDGSQIRNFRYDRNKKNSLFSVALLNYIEYSMTLDENFITKTKKVKEMRILKGKSINDVIRNVEKGNFDDIMWDFKYLSYPTLESSDVQFLLKQLKQGKNEGYLGDGDYWYIIGSERVGENIMKNKTP